MEANSLTHTHEFKYKYQLADHIPQKHSDKINRDHARDLVFITRQVETILTEALIKKGHLQQEGINPEYENVLS